jgi:ABC-type sugar transport system permease subunit
VSTTASAEAPTVRPGPTAGKVTDKTRAERKLGLMLCAPAVVMMLLVTAYPIVYAFILSLQKKDLRFPGESGFVGLSNYATVLGSSLWWQAVFNTAFITVVSVVIELVIGMGIAIIMHRAIFGRGVVRTAVLIPYGIVTVVAAFAWFYAFDPSSGFVNHLPFIPNDEAWFGGRFSSFAVIIMAEIWKTTPFMALLLLAGLATIDESLYEAARVDGASAWQRFWRITLPLLKPALLIILVIRLADAFRVFDSVYVLTGGGPGGSTEVMSSYLYRLLFTNTDFAGGAAAAVVFVLIIGACAWAVYALLRDKEDVS